MAGGAVGKRRFHAFLSHAHVDKARADDLYRFLSNVAKVPIWYDAVNLPASAIIADDLFRAIENSRAAIILLSRQSVTRGWVQQEFRAALNHQTQHPEFRIIPIRLDDVEPPNFLQNYSNVAIGLNGLDASVAAHILKGLYQPPHAAFDAVHGRNSYVSRGWHPGDADLADIVCGALTRAGLQLVGDAEDQPSWIEERIAGIIESCGAFVAILPYRADRSRGKDSRTTSTYVLREWKLAADRGLPCLVVPDARVELPPEVAEWPGLVPPTDDADVVLERAFTLAEDWTLPRREPSIFYATDFATEGRALRSLVKEVVEATTAVPCRVGEYVEGEAVQRDILRSVMEVSLVLADISGDGPNVYVEIGAARAAEVPVVLLRKGPLGRPAFMLRDQQVWDYETDAELIARAVHACYPYRRSLLTVRGVTGR